MPAEILSNANPGASTIHARIAPSLAAYCLDYNNGRFDAPYRLYEVIRAIDTTRRGALSFALIRDTLTRRDSGLYLYGRRRLLEVLRRGEGLFWHRSHNSRGDLVVWVHGRARVAAVLGVTLRGREVLLPVTALVAGDVDHGRGRQANANAALYATFHAGRVQLRSKNKLVQAAELGALGKLKTLPVNPISRQKLIGAAGVSKYRQRSYERRAGIVTGRNFQVVEVSDHTIDRAKYQDIPVFKFTDHIGAIGPKGAKYGARRLPNTYHAPDSVGPLFSQRTHKLNEAADRLRISVFGDDATSSPNAGQQTVTFNRVFYQEGKAAIRAWEREGKTLYWRSASPTNGVTFWRRLPPRHKGSE